jgi:5-methylcytosine-specific restriction protein A
MVFINSLGTVKYMPMKPPKRCATIGCANLVHTIRCNEHQKVIDKARREKEHWRDYGSNWKFIRARVLKAEPNCRFCGEVATEVDHITPLKNGGTHDINNLRPLCKSCHSRRTYYDTINKK